MKFLIIIYIHIFTNQYPIWNSTYARTTSTNTIQSNKIHTLLGITLPLYTKIKIEKFRFLLSLTMHYLKNILLKFITLGLKLNWLTFVDQRAMSDWKLIFNHIVVINIMHNIIIGRLKLGSPDFFTSMNKLVP